MYAISVIFVIELICCAMLQLRRLPVVTIDTKTLFLPKSLQVS